MGYDDEENINDPHWLVVVIVALLVFAAVIGWRAIVG